MNTPLLQTDLEELGPVQRGKVRDIYDLGDQLLLIATDRLSAYDHVLSPGIPDKGKLLHQLANYWFLETSEIVPNHLAATSIEEFPADLEPFTSQLRGRAALVHKAEVIPFECVARGYLAGSAFSEYRATGSACGHQLPPGLRRAERLPEPIFTPATKAASGHDENIEWQELVDGVGLDLATRLRELTLSLYQLAAARVAERGLLLADTKFEFGLREGELLLIDEALTPDSSRYWDATHWSPGSEPASFDKQYVRNWLDAQGWDHESEPPDLSEEVVAGTRSRYLEAFERITGRSPEL